MKTAECRISLPNTEECMDQDEEWFLFFDGENSRKIRMHDYAELFNVPGLYEEVVYDKLECNSPEVVCNMLKEEIKKRDECPGIFNVLDFGAGNGIVGECIKKKINCAHVIGIDIIPEARKAAQRDRPGVYDAYHIMDMTTVNEKRKELLKSWNLNVLITVAALGFDDIPTRAFMNAFNLLEQGSWVAFNIKDRFLTDQDTTGFKESIDTLTSHNLNIYKSKVYRHRLAMDGTPLHYIAIVGKKERCCP